MDNLNFLTTKYDQALYIYDEVLPRGGISNEALKRAYDLGMLASNQMRMGHYYLGYSRNANMAHWNGEVFAITVWEQTQWLFDEIVHPDQDEGFDIFVPTLDITQVIDTALKAW